jgi:hypothetical protein
VSVEEWRWGVPSESGWYWFCDDHHSGEIDLVWFYRDGPDMWMCFHGRDKRRVEPPHGALWMRIPEPSNPNSPAS